MSYVNKYRDLVERLYEETIAKRLRWELDQWQVDPIVQIGDRVITLSSKEADETPFEVMTISRSDGTQIDSFDDELLKDLTPRISGGGNYFILMQNLRLTAMRSAKGVDDALDDILRQLDSNSSDEPDF